MSTARFSRRRFAALGAATALALALSACGGSSGSGSAAAGSSSSSQPTLDVNFGYIGDFNGTSLLAVADQQGIWAKHGLKVSTKVFTNGPLQVQALGTGDLDFGYIGPGAFWLPASGKAKIIAMNTLGNADRVIAQKGITSLADLKGKTIAVPQGTSGDMILSLALKKAELTKDDVKIVNMDAATLVPAFANGQVQAAGFWYPAISTIKAQVPDLVELAKDSDFSKTMAFPTAFVAGNDVAADKTERVVAALREAMDYRAKHLDQTVQATAKMLSLDPAQVKADAANSKVLTSADLDRDSQDGTIDGWLKAMDDFFVSSGQLTAAPKSTDFYEGDQFVAAGK